MGIEAEDDHRCLVGQNGGIARTVAQVMSKFVDQCARPHGASGYVDIASGYFNLAGWAEICNALNYVVSVRLLIGSDPDDLDVLQSLAPGDGEGKQSKPAWEMAILRQFDEGILELLEYPNLGKAAQVKAIRALVCATRGGALEVRKASGKRFMHSKLLIAGELATGARSGDGLLIGSANLTGAGLLRNKEFCISSRAAEAIEAAQSYFDSAFNDDSTIARPLLDMYLPLPDRVRPEEIRARAAMRIGEKHLLPGDKWPIGTMGFNDLRLEFRDGSGAMVDASLLSPSEFLVEVVHDETNNGIWVHVKNEVGSQITDRQAISMIDHCSPDGDTQPSRSSDGFPTGVWKGLWAAWKEAERTAIEKWNNDERIVDPDLMRPAAWVAIA